MAIGGSLKVSNNSGSSFSVSFSRNTTITNYSDREMGKTGDTKVEIKNGQSGTSRRVYSNKTSSAEAGATFNSSRYAIFDALRKLDGNASDVSEKDLAGAKSLIGKNGVTNVRMDAKAGVTTLICDDGAVLRFDVETDAEKQVREKAEAQKALRKQDAAKAKKAERQQQKADFHENCKSALEKFGDGVGEFFKDLFGWAFGK